MRNHRSTLFLFAGVLLLGAFIWLVERRAENSAARALREKTLFAVHPDTVDFLRLERGDVRIECARKGGVWRMTYPADAPVDEGIIEKMIAGLARVERGERITAETLRKRGLTAADYGFDAPRARITFKNNRGLFTWLIGRDAPLGGTLYVKAENGDDIIPAEGILLNLVPKDPAWIRDRTLFHGPPSAVRGLDLRRPSGFLQLRRTDGQWMMQQPRAGRAGGPAVHGLLDRLFAGRIVSFTTDTPSDLTAYGLEEPAYELTLFAQDESTQTLRIGKAPPEQPEVRFAKRVESDTVFTVPAAWLAEADVEAAALRDYHLTGIQPSAAAALKIERGGQPVELVRSNGLWTITRPSRWTADPERVDEFLQAVLPAAVAGYSDDPDSALAAMMSDPEWLIEVTSGSSTGTLRVSRGFNGQRYVRQNGDPSLAVIESAIFRPEFSDPLFYRHRTVLEIDPGQIESLAVRSGETSRSISKNSEGLFRSADPERQTDSEVLLNLFQALSRLQADRFEMFNPPSLDPWGLAEPAAEISIGLSGTDRIGRVILIGNETSGGRFAMLQGQMTVFVLSAETVSVLTRDLTRPAAARHD